MRLRWIYNPKEAKLNAEKDSSRFFLRKSFIRHYLIFLVYGKDGLRAFDEKYESSSPSKKENLLYWKLYHEKGLLQKNLYKKICYKSMNI